MNIVNQSDPRLFKALTKKLGSKINIVEVDYGEYYIDYEANKKTPFIDHEDVDGPYTWNDLRRMAIA